MTTATATLPPISPSLQTAIRAYGLANGWKNAARALAYGPVTQLQAMTASKPRRNGHKKVRWIGWWENGRLQLVDYHATKGWDALGYANERAHEIDRTRFEREIPAPFTPARPTTERLLDESDVRLTAYEPAECCGQRMGIMERWDSMSTTNGSDNGYLDTAVTAICQCAENAKHQHPAVPCGTRKRGKS